MSRPYSELVTERGWSLCSGGVGDCHRIVFGAPGRCDDCQRLADDLARDAQAELLS